MIDLRTGARVALAGVAAATVVGGVQRWRERQRAYNEAQQRARATGRQLVVVGDPDAGFHTRVLPAYGCGDVCLDIEGCPSCDCSQAVDLVSGRADVPDDSAVVFVSCVLEYVSDPQAAMREIERMAGRPENIFIVAVQPWDLITATFYPGAQQVVSRAPDGTLRSTPVATGRKIATAVVLAGLVAAAVGSGRRGRARRRAEEGRIA